jgi:hypothetical protein
VSDPTFHRQYPGPVSRAQGIVGVWLGQAGDNPATGR